MSFNDSLSDMLTRIRNAHKVNQNVTHCFSSNLNSNVLKVLKDEGYIRDYSKIDIREGVSKIKIELKYYQGLPVIKKLNVFLNLEYECIQKLKNSKNPMEA